MQLRAFHIIIMYADCNHAAAHTSEHMHTLANNSNVYQFRCVRVWLLPNAIEILLHFQFQYAISTETNALKWIRMDEITLASARARCASNKLSRFGFIFNSLLFLFITLRMKSDRNKLTEKETKLKPL